MKYIFSNGADKFLPKLTRFAYSLENVDSLKLFDYR